MSFDEAALLQRATLAVREVQRCGRDAIYPVSEREVEGCCRSGNMPGAYGWGMCKCEFSARAALTAVRDDA